MSTQFDSIRVAASPAADTAHFIHYKPVCVTASLSLVAAAIALVSAIAVTDLGPWAFAPVPVVGALLGGQALRTIRRYDMAGGRAAKAGIALSLVSLAGGVGSYAYSKATEAPSDYLRIGYEALEPRGAEMVPEEARALNGRKAFIHGYVYPTGKSTGITNFLLCRDNSTCCFGGQPKLHDMIDVTLEPPLTLDYSTGLRGVGGVLRVREEPSGPGGVLYSIEAANVIR